MKLLHPNVAGYKTPPQQNNTRGCETRSQQLPYRPEGVETTPQVRWYTFINDPGFYELVFGSKLK